MRGMLILLRAQPCLSRVAKREEEKELVREEPISVRTEKSVPISSRLDSTRSLFSVAMPERVLLSNSLKH